MHQMGDYLDSWLFTLQARRWPISFGGHARASGERLSTGH